MELLRPEDRQRLLSFRNSSNPPSSKTSTPVSHGALQPAALTAGASAGVPPPSSNLQRQQEALAAWRGVQTSTQTFKPFEKNPSKQARYELYLSRLKQGDKDALEQSLDPGMTEWERSREREEFVRASILYRPSSSSLSSRFTRPKHQEDDDTVEVSRDEEGDVDDKQAAVKMKMFGKLTRETFEWHPDKLLCKRFNVPDPYPGSGMVGLPKVKRDKFSVFNFLTVTESRETAAPPKPPEPGKKSRWDVSEKKKDDPLSELLTAARNQTETKVEQTSMPALPASISDQTPGNKPELKSADQQSSDKKKEGDEEEEEEEEESRPSMDLFKAIFASSSDEKSSSSSEGESDGEEVEKDTKEDEGKMNSQLLNLFNIPSTSATSSTSTTTTTISTTSTITSSSVTTSSQPTAAGSSQTSTQEEEEFGPKLPPPSSAFIRGGTTSIRSPSEEEKPDKRSKEKKHKNKKQHKHKKDKKKKKHKKHKHKGKQQKKSKKEESDSSSEDSDEDGGDREVSTDELLKRLKSVRSHQTW